MFMSNSKNFQISSNSNNLIFDIIILLGGFGTRLQKVSNGTPKALMPIVDSVYLDILLEKVFKHDIGNVYLSLYYKSELFQNYVDNSIDSRKLITIIEPEPLGTGGAVKYVIENSNISSLFFVINGDSLSNINLNQMAAVFYKSNFKAMVGISGVDEATRYGVILEQEGKVISFEEKGVKGSGWINNGHYIFNKEAFNAFTGAFSLEKTLFPKLIEDQDLGAFKVTNDNFIDIGIPEDYAKICKLYEESN